MTIDDFLRAMWPNAAEVRAAMYGDAQAQARLEERARIWRGHDTHDSPDRERRERRRVAEP